MVSQRVAGVPPVIATGEPEGWEMIVSAYLMISLNSPIWLSSLKAELAHGENAQTNVDFSNHPQWNHENGWKNVLNNFRSIVQPTILLWLVSPWLNIFPNSSLLLGFHDLIDLMNQFKPFYHSGLTSLIITN